MNIGDIAVLIILFVVLTQILLLPSIIFFNKRRKAALNIVIAKCESFDKNKLKDFIEEQWKHESFLRKFVNESIYSFQPYVQKFINKSVKDGVLSSPDLAIYNKNNRAVVLLVRVALIEFILLFITFILLGLLKIISR